MVTNPNYADLLKDPRWQRKRLEVLQRAGWMCEECGDHTTTLHVHHRQYLKGRNPWDYPDELLQVLCEKCHRHITSVMEDIQHLLATLSIDQLEKVSDYANCGAPDIYETASFLKTEEA